jgi:hypothetical protein
MEPAIDYPMKKAPRKALLVYCVMVFLLAWWPWNVWLIFGAAYASRLKDRKPRRLLATNPSKSAIGRPQRIEQVLIPGDGLYASGDGARVVRDKHFGNAA